MASIETEPIDKEVKVFLCKEHRAIAFIDAYGQKFCPFDLKVLKPEEMEIVTVILTHKGGDSWIKIP